MKIVAFNGSARKDGNTAILVNYVFKELNQEGISIIKTLGQNMAWLLKKVREKQCALT